VFLRRKVNPMSDVQLPVVMWKVEMDDGSAQWISAAYVIYNEESRLFEFFSASGRVIGMYVREAVVAVSQMPENSAEMGKKLP
jgi:hypothetical protein